MKLTYHRCGDYLLPDLTIPDESVTLGKYGRMRKTYLKEHKPILYNTLLLSGKLSELNRIRDWTRKVSPDALPRMSDGRVSVEDAVETAVNRKELEQVINDAEKNALRQSDDPLQTNQSAPIHFLAI